MCANVGDSRAMMASLNPKSRFSNVPLCIAATLCYNAVPNGILLSKPLSVDHKPHRPDERARISKSSAKVRNLRVCSCRLHCLLHPVTSAHLISTLCVSRMQILSERSLGIDGGDPDKYYVCRVHNGYAFVDQRLLCSNIVSTDRFDTASCLRAP